MKILFVGTGNVRRSIMSVAMLRNMIKGTEYEGEIMCQSCGIAPRVGACPKDEVKAVLSEIGIDVDKYKARKFNKEEIEVWDVYFVTSETHAYILEQAGVPIDKIYRTTNSIDDPLDGKEIEDYRICRDLLKKEIETFFSMITSCVRV